MSAVHRLAGANGCLYSLAPFNRWGWVVAVYQIDIEKSYLPSTGSLVYWTNVYHVEAASLSAASTSGANIATIEKAVHQTTVNYTKMRVRPYGVPGNVGTIVPLTGTGARTAVDSLPLFNVWRVDFAVAVGRPNRKYLRGPIAEGDQASGLISPSITSTILTTNYINPLLALGVLVDTQGNSVTSGNAWPYVGMRQLRRGSKRKTTPVI